MLLTLSVEKFKKGYFLNYTSKDGKHSREFFPNMESVCFEFRKMLIDLELD